jgi:cytochrome c oxidase subunit 2
VIAHQWWWEVRYQGDPQSRSFVTANELHIPVGQPVQVRLHAADVIHSFWVPQLAGKTDTIPGQTNKTWLQADHPGTYYGQCTEYCGAQHAHMAFVVVAQAAGQFTMWWDHQLSDPAPPGGLAAKGRDVFMSHCAACHKVRGTSAGGILGPDLSHVAGRSRIPSGMLPNDPEHLSAWISHPQAVKPGALMPEPQLDADQVQAVLAYLETLQ